MTNQITAYAASTGTGISHDTTLRATELFGLVGGSAWVIDTVTIAILNRSFDPLDSVLFFLGLACSVLTVVALAGHLSRGREGAARIGTAVGAFLATVVTLGAASFGADALARRIFSPANIGLHDEWSCFVVGLGMLAIAGWAHRRARQID